MDKSALTHSPHVERLAALYDLRELYRLVKRHFLLMSFIVALITGLFVACAFIIPARYLAQAVVMLDLSKANVTNMPNVVSNLPSNEDVVHSETDIIGSRAVIDRVMQVPGLVDELQADKEIGHIDFIDQTLQVIASYNDDLNEFFKPYFAKLSVDTEQDRSRVADYIGKRLDVSNDDRSYTIMIEYHAKDPALAAKVANAFADAYLQEQLDAKKAVAEHANKWLNDNIGDLRQKVQDAEKAVEDYRTANNLTGVGDETIVQQQLVAINGQLVQARADQSSTQAKLDSVEKILKEKGNLAAASTVLSSPLIQSLEEQEAEVSRNAAQLSTRYGDLHPSIVTARAQLKDIHTKISEEVSKIVQGMRNDVNEANARVDSLQKELDGLKTQTDEGSQVMVQLRQLQREADANRALYESFLNRSKEISQQEEMQMPDSRIIAHAQPPVKPYFPGKVIFAIIGFVLGGFTGFIVILLIEYFDPGFRSAGEIEKSMGVPGIGMVPALKRLKGAQCVDYVLKKPLSAYAESLRTIRNSIQFINPAQPPKVVLVTSSVPHEGKTTFSISFARLLAEAGAKVLLIDADMRHPKVCGLVDIDKTKPAFADVLKNRATLSDAVQKDKSGADVLISHVGASVTENFLKKDEIEALIAKARPLYDWIILDTPPVLAVADVAVMADASDVALYLVQWAETPREVVSHGLRQLSEFKIKLAGTVLTQVDLDKQARYGYGDYGYYYGHYKKYYTN